MILCLCKLYVVDILSCSSSCVPSSQNFSWRFGLKRISEAKRSKKIRCAGSRDTNQSDSDTTASNSHQAGHHQAFLPIHPPRNKKRPVRESEAAFAFARQLFSSSLCCFFEPRCRSVFGWGTFRDGSILIIK